jgi:hypothetical protein
MKRISPIFLAFIAVFVPQLARAQGTVNEKLETAVIYVDGATGSDSNPGTQALPLKTISAAATKAISNNRQKIGSRVIINPGTYREMLDLNGSYDQSSLPMTFEAASSGVIISGAVQYTDWTAYSGNESIYTTQWLNKWGLCAPNTGGSPFQQEVVLRREMIFVNGTPLTQVMALGQMQEGTFFVDESANLVYAWPAGGININSADVEVATLPELARVVSRSNIVLRGLTFQYANSCRNDSAAYVAGSNTQNIIFDNDQFIWNNAVGLALFEPVTNFTVQSSVASHNGQAGMMSTYTKYGLWESSTVSFNNWRGAQGVYDTWASGGFHFYGAHDHTVSGFVTAYNQTHGVHWDTDNQNITVTDLVAVQNLEIGAAAEKSEGPIKVSGSYFCNNNLGLKQNYQWSGGFVLRNSEQVSLTNSFLYGNEVAQINVIGTAGGISVTNWETGQEYNLRSENFTNTGNTLYSAASTQNVFEDDYLGDADWDDFQTTLKSNKNVWWNSSNTSSFVIPFAKSHPFSGWQSATGQDASSSWSKPSGEPSECSVASDPDYWIVASTPSQTISSSGTTTLGLELLSFGGLSGTASLTFDGITEVAGLSASFSAKSIPVNNGSTSLVIRSSDALAGTYPVTVIATSGGITRTATVSLIVQ